MEWPQYLKSGVLYEGHGLAYLQVHYSMSICFLQNSPLDVGFPPPKKKNLFTVEEDKKEELEAMKVKWLWYHIEIHGMFE